MYKQQVIVRYNLTNTRIGFLDFHSCFRLHTTPRNRACAVAILFFVVQKL